MSLYGTTWAEFNLSQRRETFAQTATDIRDRQADGEESRTSLAAKTRSFGKLEPEKQMKNISRLLKLYQTEINTLTQRALVVESDHIGLLDFLSTPSLPDPANTVGAADLQALTDALQAERLRVNNLQATLQAERVDAEQRMAALIASSSSSSPSATQISDHTATHAAAHTAADADADDSPSLGVVVVDDEDEAEGWGSDDGWDAGFDTADDGADQEDDTPTTPASPSPTPAPTPAPAPTAEMAAEMEDLQNQLTSVSLQLEASSNQLASLLQEGNAKDAKIAEFEATFKKMYNEYAQHLSSLKGRNEELVHLNQTLQQQLDHQNPQTPSPLSPASAADADADTNAAAEIARLNQEITRLNQELAVASAASAPSEEVDAESQIASLEDEVEALRAHNESLETQLAQATTNPNPAPAPASASAVSQEEVEELESQIMQLEEDLAKKEAEAAKLPNLMKQYQDAMDEVGRLNESLMAEQSAHESTIHAHESAMEEHQASETKLGDVLRQYQDAMDEVGRLNQSLVAEQAGHESTIQAHEECEAKLENVLRQYQDAMDEVGRLNQSLMAEQSAHESTIDDHEAMAGQLDAMTAAGEGRGSGSPVPHPESSSSSSTGGGDDALLSGLVQEVSALRSQLDKREELKSHLMAALSCL